MKFKSILALSLALILITSFPSAAFAMTYKDVPYSHYAYTAVDWVSNPANGSFMVGDAANNFNPNRTLDKFETAKIFAVAAGYKYAASSISTAERELFDRSYSEWQSLLDSQASQYSKWSRTADREIAYLLYKNILTPTDVATFVTRTNGVEQVNLISKQEAIVYMVRLDGKQTVAESISLPYHTPYKDDAQIRADYKKYLYYAKEVGIAGGSDGYITPTRSFTRAEMAQMFYNLFANRPQAQPAVNTPSASTETIGGVIDYVYMNTHVYINNGAQANAYKLASGVVILVDNAQRTPADLVKGMTVTAVVSNGEIISLVANSTAASNPTPTPPPEPTPTPKPTATPTPVTLYSDEGYITDVSSSNETLKIKTQRVNLYGEVIADEKTFTLADTCTITRDGSRENFDDISEGDIVAIKYNGTVLYSVELEEKDRTINGILIERKTVGSAKTKIMVIADEDDEDIRYELRVTNSTDFTRNNSSKSLNWDDIRIGDLIEAECEYDEIVEAHAEGEKSTVRCTLESIKISGDTHEITVEDDDNDTMVYQLPSDTYDIYSLRIGEELRLYLDSWEITRLTVVKSADDDAEIIYGLVIDLDSNNRFDVEEFDTDDEPREFIIRVNASTKDADTGDAFDFDDLEEDMEVCIILDDDIDLDDVDEDDELLAASIEILDN